MMNYVIRNDNGMILREFPTERGAKIALARKFRRLYPSDGLTVALKTTPWPKIPVVASVPLVPLP